MGTAMAFMTVLSIAVCRMRVTGAGREAKNWVSGGAGEKTGKDDPHSLMRGAHDYGSHGLKCLMGLRPDGGCMSYAPCGICPVVRTTLGRDMMFGAVISS
ncbi:hypothetical protein CE163_02650 [Bifidobacterium breve]|nr:hypothetical protein CE163_02650 [Bifidobacterium breve]